MSISTIEVFFEKWQACRNDFLLVTAPPHTLVPTMKLLIKHVQHLCARDGRGIGADGIILICADEKYLLWVINSDGTFAKNCGNGLRCAAMAFFRHSKQKQVKIAVGEKTIVCELRTHATENLVATDMGTALLNEELVWYDEIKTLVVLLNKTFHIPQLEKNFSVCEIGNRHIVFFNRRAVDYLAELGKRLQSFAAGINVHVAWRSETDKHYEARSYERGVGITAACGSGAGAIAASVFAQLSSPNSQWLQISMLGGDLLVNQKASNSGIVIAGNAKLVFRGCVAL